MHSILSTPASCTYFCTYTMHQIFLYIEIRKICRSYFRPTWCIHYFEKMIVLSIVRLSQLRRNPQALPFPRRVVWRYRSSEWEWLSDRQTVRSRLLQLTCSLSSTTRRWCFEGETDRSRCRACERELWREPTCTAPTNRRPTSIQRVQATSYLFSHLAEVWVLKSLCGDAAADGAAAADDE